jgi:hypothetical protein
MIYKAYPMPNYPLHKIGTLLRHNYSQFPDFLNNATPKTLKTLKNRASPLSTLQM